MDLGLTFCFAVLCVKIVAQEMAANRYQKNILLNELFTDSVVWTFFAVGKDEASNNEASTWTTKNY